MKKTLGKRLSREEEKEVKSITDNSVAKMLSNSHRAKGTPYQMIKLAE